MNTGKKACLFKSYSSNQRHFLKILKSLFEMTFLTTVYSWIDFFCNFSIVYCWLAIRHYQNAEYKRALINETIFLKRKEWRMPIIFLYQPYNLPQLDPHMDIWTEPFYSNKMPYNICNFWILTEHEIYCFNERIPVGCLSKVQSRIPISFLYKWHLDNICAVSTFCGTVWFLNTIVQFFLGECSSAQNEVIEKMKPQSMVNCQLNFNNNVFDFQASEIVAAETMFDTALGKIKGQNCNKSEFLLWILMVITGLRLSREEKLREFRVCCITCFQLSIMGNAYS